MITVVVFLLILCHIGSIADAFLIPSTTNEGHIVALAPSARPTTLYQSTAMEVSKTQSPPSIIQEEEPHTLENKPLAAPTPREFEWWDEACDSYLDELEIQGGERFVASHDEPDESGNTNTQNWLHVTSSNPSRRVQYEVRYVDATQTMGGVVRFGSDCEGPEGCAHGGSIASVADALTATCCFKAASERWGMTTRLECNYREAVPLGTPVRIEATVTDLKKRKASLEWSIYSLTRVDKNDNPIRHAFGSANFLLPRLLKE